MNVAPSERSFSKTLTAWSGWKSVGWNAKSARHPNNAAKDINATWIVRDHHNLKHSMNRRGFTLIELLCALVIVSVLVALMFPALRGYREKGDGLTCVANLRQIGATVNTFVAQNDGYFPEIE